MATAGPFQRSVKPKPPLKGSFPLDREGECKELKELFMKCLSERNFDNSLCREQSKNYLVCRMDKKLMQEETLTDLGFRDTQNENKSNKDS
ncbi:unnamed protein product [Clavelina lepadiformis]|uniref:Cytochrome c oxidase assembly protein COX19 n=1 Tax=Clavelina lepadiformis TaxID=159417 RepID=A0ABP0GME5_CLALP